MRSFSSAAYPIDSAIRRGRIARATSATSLICSRISRRARRGGRRGREPCAKPSKRLGVRRSKPEGGGEASQTTPALQRRVAILEGDVPSVLECAPSCEGGGRKGSDMKPKPPVPLQRNPQEYDIELAVSSVEEDGSICNVSLKFADSKCEACLDAGEAQAVGQWFLNLAKYIRARKAT